MKEILEMSIPIIKGQEKKGFTLIELIIAMAILAIVTGSLLGNYVSSQKKGRDAQRKSDLKQLQNALEAYANDHNGMYPNATTDGEIAACPAPSDGGLSGDACDWGSGEFKMTNGSTYMKQMVKDPAEGKNYYYVVTSGNIGYKLYACLENDQDMDYNSSGFTGTNCGNCGSSSLCTYGVASSNEIP